MDKLFLARLQFASTLTYHFWFVSLTLGLSIFIALMETIYVCTGQKKFKTMTQFWGKFFLINYTVGILTGLVQEFEFGMNWSEFSRFVGDVFGPPLAMETLLAFFVGSISIGIWVYGWDEVPKKVHLLFIWLVAVSSNISAFWILAANSFMQHPLGHTLASGRLQLVNFTALLVNPYLMYQYSHTIIAGLLTAGLFVMTVSSFYLLHKRNLYLFRYSFKMGVVCTTIATMLILVSGHFYTQYIGRNQPMKLAAMEALWNTSENAPLAIVALIDSPNYKNTFEISIPSMLSLLAGNRLDTKVQGMKELQDQTAAIYGQDDYIPPVPLLFWSLRIMLLITFYLVTLLVVIFWYWHKDKLEDSPILLKAVMWSLPLPYIAHTAGWIITEVGRQPWLVYTLLKTEQGVSKVVPAINVWVSLLTYTLIYGLMIAIALYFIRKTIATGPEP